MDKGVTARQNIALLRYARAVDIHLNWNLLYGFPGDIAEDYRDVLDLIPILRHLQPPTDLCRLSVDRFSPYHFDGPRYGIRGLRPMDSYFSVLPHGAAVDKVAYHFVGDYESGSLADPVLLNQLESAVEEWKANWSREDAAPPCLAVVELGGEQFVLVDGRNLEDTSPVQFLDRQQVAAVLVQLPANQIGEAQRWALSCKLALEMDGWYVPLATAAPELLAEFEGRRLQLISTGQEPCVDVRVDESVRNEAR